MGSNLKSVLTYMVLSYKYGLEWLKIEANLAYAGLNSAHVGFYGLNKPTFTSFCTSGIT